MLIRDLGPSLALITILSLSTPAFAESTEAEIVKGKIETLLAGILESDKPTHTM